MAAALLELEVRANTNKANKSLRATRNEVTKFSKIAGNEFRKVGKATAVAAAGAVAALGGLAAASLSSADSIAKSARNAGLAAEEFQGLAHVFELSGSSAQALVKGSQRLSKSITALQDGSKRSAEAFAELGLSFDDLDGKTQRQRLDLVINGLRGVTDTSRQAALAQELLGTAGRELGSVLATSAADAQLMEDRLRRLGGVIGGDVLANAERFNDEMDIISKVIRNNFTDALLRAIGTTGEFDDVLMAVIPIVRTVATTFVNLTKFIVEHASTIGTLVTAYAAYRVATSTLVTSVFSLVRAVTTLRVASAAAATGVGALSAVTSGFGVALGLVARALLPGAAIFIGLTLLIELVTGTEGAFTGLINKTKEFLGIGAVENSQLVQSLREEEAELQKLIAAREADNAMLRQGTQAQREHSAQIDKLRDRLIDVQEEIREVSIANVELTKTSATTAESVINNQNMMTIAIQGTAAAAESAAGSIERLADAHLRSVASDREASRVDRINLQSANIRRRQDREIGGAFANTSDEQLGNLSAGSDAFARTLARELGSRGGSSSTLDARNQAREATASQIRTACAIKDETVDKLVPAITMQQQGAIQDLSVSFTDTLASNLINGIRRGDFSDIGSTLADYFANVAQQNLATRLRGSSGGSSTNSFLSGLVGSFLRFHDGGIVPGRLGQEVPIVAQAGELISPAGASPSTNVTMTFNVESNDPDSVVRAITAKSRDVARIITGQQRESRL